MACSHHHPETKRKNADSCHDHGGGKDWLLWICLAIVAAGYALHLFGIAPAPYADVFSAACFELLNKMWWGITFGIFFVGALGRVPREFVMKILGKGASFSGIMRACFCGVLLDLCSHGILLVGMKLYTRGASIGQVMAFLIASPWNSLSLTLILVALIGAKWTFAFMAFSMVIAVISGMVFERLVAVGILPANPNNTDMPDSFAFVKEAKRQLKTVKWTPSLAVAMLREGLDDSKMVLRWVFLGVVLAALLRAFMPDAHFAGLFGATFSGLGLTLLAATVIEVCSEGSTPIAADLLTRAQAPGNAFAFLMAGAATDYTEIMGLRETTKSWKIALFLPLVTLPQVVALAWLINIYGV